ncbi:MAG: ATP-binding domain-containing protein, partial [Fibrobacteres bacterium]|nr:ATP-binding domain-containing protein [Fibrobacterota bacterium]
PPPTPTPPPPPPPPPSPPPAPPPPPPPPPPPAPPPPPPHPPLRSPPYDHRRLILIADRTQLASVETGSVLADICAAAEKTSNPLHGCFIELKNSYRFGNDSIIGAVSKLVREGDAESSYDLLSKNKLFISYHGKEELHRLIINECKEWLNEYRESLQSPTAAISKLSENKLLTVQHSGASGTIELNELFTRKLQKNRDSYHGIPIIITKNDADSALFNGDTGILLENSNDGSVNGYFSGLSSEIRSTPLSRLPDYSQAFALTVHKSQGSEYGKVHIVLPERGESRVLSRELIYTALTRAKKEIHVWGSKESWNAAISRPIKRKSGLLQLLQQAGTCSKKIL